MLYRYLLTPLAALLLLAATPQHAQAQTTTFAYTGGTQTYTVPAGAVQLAVVASGASGSDGYGGAGGGGAQVTATLTVTPGEVLTVVVGGQAGYNGGGANQYGGGHGGGATDLRRPYTSSTSTGDYLTSRNALLVAGGGGGGSGSSANSGGGGSSGGSGGKPNGSNGGASGGVAGGGATQTGPGGGYDGGSNNLGGNSGNTSYSGGGGGGGYYGGGAGIRTSNSAFCSSCNGSGGGGSSWVMPTGSSNISYGGASGNGTLTIRPIGPYIAVAQNVTVQLDATGNGNGTLAASSVSNSPFTATPPPGLTIQKVAYGQVAENGTLALATPNGAAFSAILFASYGNASGTNGNYVLGSCNAPTSQSVVSNALLTKTSGSIVASNTTFTTDPCSGTAKALSVVAAYSADAATQPYTCADVAGPNYVRLTSTDPSGNTSTAIAQVTVLPPPALTLSGSNPTGSTPGSTVTLTGTNLSGITGLSLGGGAITGFSVTATSLTFQVPAGAASGSLVVAAPCGQSVSRAFTVGPIFVQTPLNGSSTNVTTPTYSGVAPAGSTVMVYVDGVALSGTVTTSAGGTWSMPSAGTLGQGSHTVYAVTGGSTSPTNTFTVDTTVPTVSLSSSASSPSAAATIPFTATFSESVMGFAAGSITVTNGTVTAGAVSGSGTNYTFTVTPANNGVVTVTIAAGAAQDAAGNASTASATYSITSARPVMAVAQNVTVQLGANGTATLSASSVNNGSTPSSLTYTIQKVAYGQAVENNTLALATPNGAAFSAILFASYGNASGTNGNYVLGSCNAPTSQSVVSNALLTKTSGSIVASNTTFTTDPCSGTAKTLSVVAAYSADAATQPYTCADVAGPNYVRLTATDPGGNTSTAIAQVTVLGSPVATLTGISPVTALAGTAVTVSGTNLGPYTSITLNGLALPVSSATATAITFTVPAGASTGNVVVTLLCQSLSIALTVPADLVVNTTTTIPTGTYNTIQVVSPGVATLAGNITILGPLTVGSGATLNDGCALIGGSGSFALAAGGTLGICHAAGIAASGATGAVQVTGTRSFSTDASYVYRGTAAQVTGAGLPSQVRSLSTTNANALTLSAPLSVAQVLTVGAAGNFVLNGQALTLLSSAAGTALVVNSGTGTVVGSTATVQRYIDASGNVGASGYRHYAAPVSGATVNSLATTGFTPVVNASYNTAANSVSVTPYPTVYSYDQGRVSSTTVGTNLAAFDRGYKSPAALTDALTVGQGYTVQIGNGALVALTGTLTTGAQAIPGLAYSGAPSAGWALIGNPYPAPLDWGSLSASQLTGVGGAAYVFQSTNAYVGRYTSFTNGVGAGTGLIATGQAFFVRTTSATGAINLTNANRVTSFAATPAFQRTAAETRPLLRLSLGLGSAPATIAAAPDETFVYFEAGATGNFDGPYDAYKLPNPSGYYLGTASTNAQLTGLSIDGRAPLAAGTSVTIPVWLSVVAGTYTLTATSLLNFAGMGGGTRVQLLDALTGTLTDLTTTPSYTFGVAAGAASTGRFSLLFGTGTALAAAPATAAPTATLVPNPSEGGPVVLAVSGLGAAVRQVEATLCNALGQQVGHATLATTQGSVRADLPTQGLASGVYIVRLLALDDRGEVSGRLPTQRLSVR